MTHNGSSSSDPAGDTIAAMAVFGRVLERVNDDHLERETPCTDWNVEALISHVVLGDASVPLLFAGEPLPDSTLIDPSLLGPNPMATWRGTALAAIEALRAPGAMEREVEHPAGRRTGEVIARFRLVDVLGHAWDLSTATGIEVDLPDELAEAALEFLLPLVDALAASDAFGPALEPPEASSPAVRFLALIGRRAW
ncbi:MAG: TIGR03086 family metal-binding protein [Acidimicrobiales bacterium]